MPGSGPCCGGANVRGTARRYIRQLKEGLRVVVAVAVARAYLPQIFRYAAR